MSWIKARAYSDASFVSNRLLDQVEADIGEANRLPPAARSDLTFDIQRAGHRAVITIDFGGSNVEVVRISVVAGEVGTAMAVQIQPGKKSRAIRITARWDIESGEEQWFIDGGDSPLSVAEASRAILEPALFA